MILNLDVQSTLCLACSSSVLIKNQPLHVTSCCSQIICDSCIRANPRLATYNPCLACGGGVQTARGKPEIQDTVYKATGASLSQLHTININDEEAMFAVGDDSDGDAEEQQISPHEDKATHLSLLPTSLAVQQASSFPANNTPQLSTPLPPPPNVVLPSPNSPTPNEPTSQRYYINPLDTIHGIALRFGVDSRELCRHNGLPFSTLSTTGHLLHTRVSLELPPSSKPVPLQYVLSEEDRTEREARRTRERAQKRLQLITKEVDFQVAKAYVALADDPDISEELVSKRKEGHSIAESVVGPSDINLESRAVDMYLEDEEWEQNQSSVNHLPRISPFPFPRRPEDASNRVVKSK